MSAFILSLCFFTFGFDGGLVSGLLAMPPFIDRFGSLHTAEGTTLSATDLGLIVGFPTTGCMLGLPLSAGLGDRYGRKVTLLVGCFISAVGSAIQTAAPNLAVLIVGRWIANAAIFLFIVMGSTFLAELAPPELRGSIVGLSIVLIDLAAVFSSGLNWALSTNLTNMAWQLPTGLQVIWPGIIAFGIVVFIQDSPTFFLTRGEDERALKSLRRVRGGYAESEVQAEFQQLKAQADLRREEVHVPWTHIFKGPDLRRTLLSLSIGNMQQLSGIAFATNYATTFLASVEHEVSPYLLVTCMGILALCGAIVGLFIVDVVGRRALALTTFIILFIINVVVGVLGFTNYAENSNLSRTIAGFCGMFAFFFAAGFGPLTYVISGEMPTARLRNATNAFSFFVLACFMTVVNYVLPYISGAGEYVTSHRCLYPLLLTLVVLKNEIVR
jgi:MFS family permease